MILNKLRLSYWIYFKYEKIKQTESLEWAYDSFGKVWGREFWNMETCNIDWEMISFCRKYSQCLVFRPITRILRTYTTYFITYPENNFGNFNKEHFFCLLYRIILRIGLEWSNGITNSVQYRILITILDKPEANVRRKFWILRVCFIVQTETAVRYEFL